MWQTVSLLVQQPDWQCIKGFQKGKKEKAGAREYLMSEILHPQPKHGKKEKKKKKNTGVNHNKRVLQSMTVILDDNGIESNSTRTDITVKGSNWRNKRDLQSKLCCNGNKSNAIPN